MSSHPLDQFSPEAGEKSEELTFISLNISFDVWVLVREGYTNDDLRDKAEMFRKRYGINEWVSHVEENI